MKHLRITILCFILFACSDELGTFTMIVKENKSTCQGEGVLECYLVQEGNLIGTNEWHYFYDEIRGFEYEVGYRYTLLVAKEKISNPPADGSSIAYSLVEIKSKYKVD